MYRRGFSRCYCCAGGPLTTYTAARPLCTTAVALQLQHRAEVLGRSHGAGLVKHSSMATADIKRRVPRGVTQAPPAADLYRTSVEGGLGTSVDDPYARTLPNQESRAPETTVLQSALATAPTRAEVAALGKKWGTLQYWIGDTYPRLPVFLRSLVVPNALPVSAHAEKLVGDFGAQLPGLLRDATEADRAKVAALWSTALEEYGAVGAQNILDRPAFETKLAALHERTVAAVKAVAPSEASVLPFEVLRRKAVLKRNRFLEDGLVRLVEKGAYLGFGDGLWRVFFHAVEQHKEAIFAGNGNRMLGFAWDAVTVHEDAARTPAVSAVVALYLTLVSIAQSQSVVDAAHQKASRTLDEGLKGRGGSATNSSTAASASLSLERLQLVNPIVKRKFVLGVLQEVLSTVEGAGHLAKALRGAGFHELAREAALCEAMNDNKRLLEADAAVIVGQFSSTQEVKSLLASIVSGTDVEAKRHILQTFGLAPTASGTAPAEQAPAPMVATVDWDKTLLSVDWDTNWRRLASVLLADTATLEATSKVITAAIRAKGAVHQLFSQEYAETLSKVARARKERAESEREKVGHIVSELASYTHVDAAVQLLQGLGVPMGELVREAVAVEQGLRGSRPYVDASVLEAVLAGVAQRHPSWVAAGVLPSTASLSLVSSSPNGALDASGLTRSLELMVRMCVRVAYVPQAGAASIAQHTRRRIGPVATGPHQFNVPAEVGFVEQYDNLQYKRYDWQGWFQRMSDVHNRNVSIRCRIDDLKRLDGSGNPFVDLQTERRLRILAGDRVGMGVMKLDSDKHEDQSDNVIHGTTKLSEVLAESRKAQLGPEYWPTVEVKVRRPSGQSQAYYSTIDDERIEQRSQELYAKYRDAKKRSLFVTPMDLWLEVTGMQVRKTADAADADGYTVDSLQDFLGDAA